MTTICPVFIIFLFLEWNYFKTSEKIELEQINFAPGMSIKVFSPSLRNQFYWHYLPEYELVYVKTDAGIRHVGSHVSEFNVSELVFYWFQCAPS
jgi:hypothetical protein